MSSQNDLFIDNNDKEIADYAEKSYLNYSMYVIMNRSLPHIGDGLKPVHRRLLFAMSELRLTAQAKYKKSARTVGDTLGKFHPHGDSACYEAMVLMAQPFSTLHPLVDGQGNWGHIDDPKSFAAMRYTEAKMTQYADTLLDEIKQDTVDWHPNFDGTLKEPALLPAQLPNILLNGASGIAVGIATDIPSHNMEEIVSACTAFLKNSRLSDDEILSYITTPDLPTEGEIITPFADIHEAYRKGRGSYTVRATTETDGNVITITSAPYRVSLSNLIEKIADEIKEKKLPVDDIQDLSDQSHPVRLALTIKGEKRQAQVMSHLFAATDLEKSFRINMNMIGIDGRPEVKSLPKIIREWCAFRQQVFERKTRFRLRAVEARLHLLEGLLVAYANLDEVIRIVRDDETPKATLMHQFSLTEVQAQAILDLRLRQLAKLEENELRNEHQQLSDEKQKLDGLLADNQKIKRAMIKELTQAAKPHIIPRKTQHRVREEAKSIVQDLTISEEAVTVVRSKNNWLRQVKGHDLDLSNLNYKNGDGYFQRCETYNHQSILIMGDKGRFFGIPAHQLPGGKGMGEPITAKIQLQNNEMPWTMMPLKTEQHVLLCTAKGNGFLVPADTLDSRNKKGKQVLNLPDGDAVLHPHYVDQEQELALLTQQGRLLIIPMNEVKVSNKSQGVRLAHIKTDDFDSGHDKLIAVQPLSVDDTLILFVGKQKRLLGPDKREHYRTQRARRGVFFEGKSRSVTLGGVQ